MRNFWLLTFFAIWNAAHGQEDSTASTCSDSTAQSNVESDMKVNMGLQFHLERRFKNDPSALDSIRQKLREGKLVAIHNALPTEVADAARNDIESTPAADWPLLQHCFPTGFCFRHHNLMEQSIYSETMNRTLAIFDQPETREFMTDLSGRNCRGDQTGNYPPGAASYYMPNDFSLPHNDHILYRTVAYVWHLSKDWKPEWGGALYWAGNSEDAEASKYWHASYNTLFLFSVTTKSSHCVTAVSSEAQGKRLSFNGWWSSSWRPSVDNVDQIEDHLATLATQEEPAALSDHEILDIKNALQQLKEDATSISDGRINLERYQKLQRLFDTVTEKLYPPSSTSIWY